MYRHIHLRRRLQTSRPPPANPPAPPADAWAELEAWRYDFYSKLNELKNSPARLSRSYDRLSKEASVLLGRREIALLWNRVTPSEPWDRLVYRAGVRGRLDKELAEIPAESLGIPEESEILSLWKEVPGTREGGRAQSFAILRALPESTLSLIGIENIAERWGKWSRKAAHTAIAVLQDLPPVVLDKIEPSWVEKIFLVRANKRSGIGALDLLELIPPQLRNKLRPEPIAEVWNRCAEHLDRHEPQRLLRSLAAMPASATPLISWKHAAKAIHMAAKRDDVLGLSLLKALPEELRAHLPQEAYLALLESKRSETRLATIRLLPTQGA